MANPLFSKYVVNSDGTLSVQLWITAAALGSVESSDLTLTFDPLAAMFNGFTAPTGWVYAANATVAGTVKVAQFDNTSGFAASVGGSTDTLLGTFSLTPAAGDTSLTVNFTKAVLSNGTSTTVLAITSPVTSVIPLTATAAIVANTPTVTNVAKGQTETVSFLVTLSQPLLQAATVAYTVAGTTLHPATAADFAGGSLPGGTLTFNALQTTATVTLTLAGTNHVDFDHAFTVTLGTPTGAILVPTATATATATETVLNTNTSKASITATDAVKSETGTGTTNLTFTVTLDEAPVAAQTLTYSVVAGTGASAANFVGNALPTGTVTFAAGQTAATVTIAAQNSALIQQDAAFSVVLSNPSSRTAIVAASAEGDLLNGTGSSLVVYDWKSHDLLSNVALSATAIDQSSSTTPHVLTLQNLHLDASGNLVAELFGDAGTGASSFDARFNLPTGVTASFASALSGWTVTQNAATAGSFSLAGLSSTTATGATDLGTLTFTLPAGTSASNIVLAAGHVGTAVSAPLQIEAASGTTDATGTITGVLPGAYTVSVARTASTDIGSTITAADALAAMKLALGLNPNPIDSNGTQAAVSPYQFIAADVLGQGTVTSADALAILRMAVGLPTPATSKWEFLNQSQTFWDPVAKAYTVTAANVPTSFVNTATVDNSGTTALVGVLTGDVLGRWAPLDATGAAIVNPGTVSDSYFAAQSASTGAPLSLYGYNAGVPSAVVALAAYAAQPSVTGIAVTDTAASISANFDSLAAIAPALSTITLRDTATPLRLTAKQYATSGAIRSKIAGPVTLAVSGAQTSSVSTLQADASVSSFSVTDTASNASAVLTKVKSIISQSNDFSTVLQMNDGSIVSYSPATQTSVTLSTGLSQVTHFGPFGLTASGQVVWGGLSSDGNRNYIKASDTFLTSGVTTLSDLHGTVPNFQAEQGSAFAAVKANGASEIFSGSGPVITPTLQAGTSRFYGNGAFTLAWQPDNSVIAWDARTLATKFQMANVTGVSVPPLGQMVALQHADGTVDIMFNYGWTVHTPTNPGGSSATSLQYSNVQTVFTQPNGVVLINKDGSVTQVLNDNNGSAGQVWTGTSSAAATGITVDGNGNTNIVQTEAFNGGLAILKSDGTVTVIFEFQLAATPAIQVGTNVSSVAGDLAGGSVFMVHTDGSVTVYDPPIPNGYNNGDLPSAAVAAQLTSGVIKVVAYGGTVAALKSNGSVVVWGGATATSDTITSNLASGVVDVVVSGQNVLSAFKADGSVFSFTVNDPYTPLTSALIAAAPTAPSKLGASTFNGTAGSDTLDLTGQSEAVTANLLGNTATVSIGSQSTPVLTFIGAPDVAILGSGATTIQYALQPSSGVETIANFKPGQDILDIDLKGALASVLTATDAVYAGNAAILVASSADPTHGVVLTGLSMNAASLISVQHQTLTNGHALFT